MIQSKQKLIEINKFNTSFLYSSSNEQFLNNLIKLKILLLYSVQINLIYRLKVQVSTNRTMQQQILHSQSHIYPCQLTLYDDQSSTMNNNKKFMFYSPMNHYVSVYDSSKKQHDLIDLNQNKYDSLKTIEMKRLNKPIFRNQNQIKILNNNKQTLCENNISFNLHEQNNKLISNIIKTKLINNNSNNSSYLSYLTYSQKTIKHNSSNDQLSSGIVLNFRSLKNLQYQNDPIIDKQQNREQNPQQLKRNIHLKNNNNNNYSDQQYQPISIPIQIHNQGLDNSSINHFQLLKSQSSYNDSILSTIYAFDKKSSHLYQIDLQQDGVITNTIMCESSSPDQFQRRNIGFQHNQIKFLSQKVILNYGQNGIIKLIDKRLGRIVQVRDLLEQHQRFNPVNLQGDVFPSSNLQQNHIKFYDLSRNCISSDNPLQSTNGFLINIKNQILQIDLRQQNQPFNSIFKSNNKKDNIGQYQMIFDLEKNQKIVAYTTEGHSVYKGVVIKQGCN